MAGEVPMRFLTFRETSELADLREHAVRLLRLAREDVQLPVPEIAAYQQQAEELIDQLPRWDRIRGMVGLGIAKIYFYQQAGLYRLVAEELRVESLRWDQEEDAGCLNLVNDVEQLLAELGM